MSAAIVRRQIASASPPRTCRAPSTRLSRPGALPSPAGNSTSSSLHTTSNALSSSDDFNPASRSSSSSGSPSASLVHEKSRQPVFAGRASVELVELGESRRHAGFHWSAAEQVRAERVDRAGEEPFEVRQRRAKPLRTGGVGGFQLLFERKLETPAQLRGGLARERHGGHAARRRTLRRRSRLPCAWPSCASCQIRRRLRRADWWRSRSRCVRAPSRQRAVSVYS